MLSRVADSIYWLNRSIERAENVARFIDVNLHLMLDLPAGTTEQWAPLVDTTGDEELFQERYGEATRENVVAFLTLDTDNPNSIYAGLRAARDNARSVREIISSEMWEQVNTFYLMVRDAAAQGRVMAEPHAFFTEVKMASHLFVGITDATMSFPNNFVNSPEAVSSLSSLISLIITQAPSWANFLAMAFPIPPALPVTSAIRPVNSFGLGILCSFASSSNQYSMLNASCLGSDVYSEMASAPFITLMALI